MEIEDKQILHKIIDLLSCIVEGRGMKSLLHTNIDFFLKRAVQISFQSICMNMKKSN